MASILGTSTKVRKGEHIGVLTAVVYLAPADSSGRNICPWSSAGCRAACLAGDKGAGRMPMATVKAGQLRKTRLFFKDRPAFMAQLRKDIARHERKAKRLGMIPAVRLNGSSDIPWERVDPHLFSDFPGVTFYDYSKNSQRVGWLLPNYHVTFSRSEDTSDDTLRDVLRQGGNVAVVADYARPDEYLGHLTVDGDATDYRPADGQGVVVWLHVKGSGGKADNTGFVLTEPCHAVAVA